MKKTYLAVLVALYFSGGLSSNILAAQYDLKQMTPQVKSALEGRKGRYEQLKQFKKEGLIGENNKGYVQLMKEDAQADKIVRQENNDRKQIYETIAEQNGLKGAIGTIEKVFAAVQRDKADPGESIQLENGEWTTK
ncbi:MAG: DUF1318 domain-containing protein [Candidatus Omnitrophica bacterium]|nr:DUF1318 domain-containing protein [Candidatus Omnitrophota bacterium]